MGCLKFFNALGEKKLLAEHKAASASASASAGAPQTPVLGWDLMTTLFALPPGNAASLSSAVLRGAHAFFEGATAANPRTLIICVDKEKFVPGEKAQTQKKRASQVSEDKRYPADTLWRTEPDVQWELPKLMHSGGALRLQLYHWLAEEFRAGVTVPQGSCLLFDWDPHSLVTVVAVGDYRGPQPLAALDFGEAELGVMAWFELLFPLKAGAQPPPSLTLRTRDTDAYALLAIHRVAPLHRHYAKLEQKPLVLFEMAKDKVYNVGEGYARWCKFFGRPLPSESTVLDWTIAVVLCGTDYFEPTAVYKWVGPNTVLEHFLNTPPSQRDVHLFSDLFTYFVCSLLAYNGGNLAEFKRGPVKRSHTSTPVPEAATAMLRRTAQALAHQKKLQVPTLEAVHTEFENLRFHVNYWTRSPLQMAFQPKERPAVSAATVQVSATP